MFESSGLGFFLVVARRDWNLNSRTSCCMSLGQAISLSVPVSSPVIWTITACASQGGCENY